MKRQLLFVLLGMIFFAVIIGSVSVYLFTSNQASHLASSLSSRVAVATGLNGILQQTTYDESFLDPHDEALRITGASWQGVIEIQQRADPYVHLTALTAAGSQLEADCLTPTSAVGVQFWGDENDGWATVVVDDQYEWRGNILNFTGYVEISDLPLAAHTIRITALGEPGKVGGESHVTLAGISCRQRGPVSTILERIFLPWVAN